MRIPRPSAEAQKKAIEDIVFAKSHVHAGDTWYIIAKKWFQDWENYVQGPDTGDAPGPIDNQPLLSDGDTLRSGANEYRYIMRGGGMWWSWWVSETTVFINARSDSVQRLRTACRRGLEFVASMVCVPTLPLLCSLSSLHIHKSIPP